MDVNEELKFFGKIHKKKFKGGGGGSGGVGVRLGGQGGCERNVGGCEPRIEGIVQCTKRSCTILRKSKNVGRGRGNI